MHSVSTATPMNILLSILAIVPGLLITFFIYKLDKFDKEPVLPLVLSFALGCFITIPAQAIEGYFDAIGLQESLNFFVLLATAFVAVALVEEVAKFFCVIFYAYPQKFFNEPLDGIVYAIMVGMGFATVENLWYAQQFDAATLVVRAFTAVPAHAAFAVISGYYIGLARFNRKLRNRYLLQGLGFAVLVHGLYDFFILQLYFDALIILACVVLLISLYFARKLFLEHLNLSSEASRQRALADVATTNPTTKKEGNDIEDAILDELMDDGEE